jgi:hypothetical protein
LIDSAEQFPMECFDERFLMSAMDDQVENMAPVSAIRRDGRGPGPVVGMIEGAQRAPEPDSEPEEQAVPSEAVEEANQDVTPRPLKRMRANGAIPLLAGGISGAIAAIIALFLLNTFQPPLDPRVVPMASQLSGFVQQMYNLETSLRAVEVDLVRLLDRDGATASRLAAQEAKIADGLSQIAAARETLQSQNGPGSPVFGVAVVQLMNAIDAGRPFESEWVNLFALTADTPELREAMMPLVSVVRDGVESPAALSGKLRARALELGIPLVSTGDFVQAGLVFLRDRLGLQMGISAGDEVVRAVLARTDELLRIGQLDDALATFSNLGDATTGDFEEWFASAQSSVTARRIVDRLSVVSRARLRDRARNSATANTAAAAASN